MTRSLKITEDCSDVLERNIFIANKKTTGSEFLETFEKHIKSAKDKICVVLESGLSDHMERLLVSTAARKYIIVPDIKEEKYKNLAGKIIIREVSGIRGNYLLTDEQALFLFDADLSGISITDGNVIRAVYQMFQREFWGADVKFEFVDKKEPAAEITFDLPPVFSSDSLLIDLSQNDQTQIKGLIDDGTEYGFLDKVGKAQSAKKLVIKKISVNKDYLEKTNNEDIVYAPFLPFSYVRKGRDCFALNFDIEKYSAMPEKETGRLFAVRCEDFSPQGQTYKFTKHRTREELVSLNALNIDGKALNIVREALEDKEIEIDLSQFKTYSKMSEELLKNRLQSKGLKLIDSEKKACKIEFNIAVKISKHKIKNKASVYDRYSALNRKLTEKRDELKKAAESMKLNDLATAISEGVGKGVSNDMAGYKTEFDRLNVLVSRYNQSLEKKPEIDESLADVKGSNKKNKPKNQTVESLTLETLSMDLPRYGMLYQDGSKYEYVLNKEEYVDLAEKEMKTANIENVTFHLE